MVGILVARSTNDLLLSADELSEPTTGTSDILGAVLWEDVDLFEPVFIGPRNVVEKCVSV